MVASGNDFVVMRRAPCVIPLKRLAQNICDRKYGIGADGLLVLEKSKIADVKMRIFNADGSEAEMCGNGARCIALYCSRQSSVACLSGRQVSRNLTALNIETKAGIIEAKVNGDKVKIKLTSPKDIKLNLPIKLNNRTLRVNFINTGVPHAVIFVQGLDNMDIVNLGRQIRFHKKFTPRGTNVDFVEVLSNNSIRVRTYERGVEDETLACGTGSIAAALITAYSLKLIAYSFFNVYTRGGEILKVYFSKSSGKISNVWLEGKARVICKGEFLI